MIVGHLRMNLQQYILVRQADWLRTGRFLVRFRFSGRRFWLPDIRRPNIWWEKVSRISHGWCSYFEILSVRSSFIFLFIFHLDPRNKVTMESSTEPSCERTQTSSISSFSSATSNTMLLHQEPEARRECSENNARGEDPNNLTLLVSIIDDVLLLLESSDEFDFDEEGSQEECSVYFSSATNGPTN